MLEGIVKQIRAMRHSGHAWMVSGSNQPTATITFYYEFCTKVRMFYYERLYYQFRSTRSH